MLYISELLPNPAGKDTEGEWIEICNSGSETQSLAGWKLQNAKGKSFAFPNEQLEPYACRAFDYSLTRITLTNNGGSYLLLNPSGSLTDAAAYEGAYADNISAMRSSPSGAFVKTTTPTKGCANKLTEPATKKTSSTYTYQEQASADRQVAQVQTLHEGATTPSVLFSGLLITIALTALFWYAFKHLYVKKNSDGI